MTWQQRLSHRLVVSASAQDWGIENADANRVDEFIAFYGAHRFEDDWEYEVLAELILQSAEEALEAKILNPQSAESVRSFFRIHHHEFPITTDYWKNLDRSQWLVPLMLFGENDV